MNETENRPKRGRPPGSKNKPKNNDEVKKLPDADMKDLAEIDRKLRKNLEGLVEEVDMLIKSIAQ